VCVENILYHINTDYNAPRYIQEGIHRTKLTMHLVTSKKEFTELN